jgi:hypothetical protein
MRIGIDRAAAPIAHPEAYIETQQPKAPTINTAPAPIQDDTPQRPAAGPTISITNPVLDETAATATAPSDDAPFSPYTFNRQRLRELTMPPVPNFDITDAPPPPAQNSEEAATLAAVAKQFERFLEMKKQGIHFNERLQNSTALRNPSMLLKLMDFAGITEGECYETTLPAELSVLSRWPEDCYVESLVKQNERREKKRLAEREKVDFVPAQATSGKSTLGDTKRSKFDKR